MKTRTRLITGLAGVALLLGVLALGGCVGGGAAARGWAGVSEVQGTLVFVTMAGRVYSVDPDTAAVRGTPIPLTQPVSGGLLSCGGASSAPIAIYSNPVAANDLVFIGGNDGKVYAFRLIEGALREQPRWIYPPQGNVGAGVVGGLTVANGNVYFAAANGTVYALDAADGFKRWSHETGDKVWSAPTVAGDTIYLTTFERKVYALGATNGEEKWVYETEGALSAPAVVADGMVYVGGYDRNMYALNAATGQPVWKFPVEGTAVTPSNWFWARPAVYDGKLYAPNLDGNVYALDARTGALVQTYDLGDKVAVASSPVVVGDQIIVAATNLASKKSSAVFAIDTATGGHRQLGTGLTEGIIAPLFASGSIVYIHTTGDKFFGLDVENGALQPFVFTVTPTK